MHEINYIWISLPIRDTLIGDHGNQDEETVGEVNDRFRKCQEVSGSAELTVDRNCLKTGWRNAKEIRESKRFTST